MNATHYARQDVPVNGAGFIYCGAHSPHALIFTRKPADVTCKRCRASLLAQARFYAELEALRPR